MCIPQHSSHSYHCQHLSDVWPISTCSPHFHSSPIQPLLTTATQVNLSWIMSGLCSEPSSNLPHQINTKVLTITVKSYVLQSLPPLRSYFIVVFPHTHCSSYTGHVTVPRPLQTLAPLSEGLPSYSHLSLYHLSP